MDWSDPVTFNHYYRTVRGLSYHFIDQKPFSLSRVGTKADESLKLTGRIKTDVIVLLHGFPDLWYGWRRVIPLLTNEGFRVIAPDLRGYGQTDAPQRKEDYALAQTAADIIALLQSLSIHQAFFIGHDWGGEVAYRIALRYPNWCKGVVSVCTPFTPAGPNFVRMEHVVKRWPSLRYQLYFIQGEDAVQEFNSNIEKFFKYTYRSMSDYDSDVPIYPLQDGRSYLGKMYQDPPLSSILSQKELDYYVSQYRARGFKYPLQWYRNRRTNWKNDREIPDGGNIYLPVLYIKAEKDVFLVPEMGAKMKRFVPNLTVKTIEDCSHWVLTERPVKLVQLIKEWIVKYSSSGASKL